jgi:uncharacterized protein (AIM24 family)
VSDYRTKIDEQGGAGVRFELYQFRRKSYALSRAQPSSLPPAGNTAAPAIHLHPPQEVSARQVRIVLDGGAALLEPGALQYAHGALQVEVQKNERGGIFARAMASAGTGESAYATRYSGRGEVWTEATAKHFILASMDGPQDALILDDGAFYACDGDIAVSTHVHRSSRASCQATD